MPNIETLQLGALAIIFLFTIKEFFVYLRSKKVNGKNNDIVSELQKMNNNHLTSIQKAISEGNMQVVKAINEGNMKIIELLAEIKGNLNK